METTSRIQTAIFIIDGLCGFFHCRYTKIQVFYTTSSGGSRRPYHDIASVVNCMLPAGIMIIMYFVYIAVSTKRFYVRDGRVCWV
jgi:hypothetical protein